MFLWLTLAARATGPPYVAGVHGFLHQPVGALPIESQEGKGTAVPVFLPCAT